jgi:general secretion pathway protein G
MQPPTPPKLVACATSPSPLADVTAAGCPPVRTRRLSRLPRGWTLIELLLVVVIIGILVAILRPNVQGMIERAKIAKAIGDIQAIQVELATFRADGDSLPATLASIGRDTYLDPWGKPYQYLNFSADPNGKPRKDHFLHQINSDYDLYSMGKDGKSNAPLTASASRDDVIRANDGGFVGPAARY